MRREFDGLAKNEAKKGNKKKRGAYKTLL